MTRYTPPQRNEMQPADIVARLREWYGGTESTYLMFAEAADEIERLREQLERMKAVEND